MASLRDKTISGIFWSLLQKVGARGVSFVVMIILARLLTPADFGMIGMLMIFIQVSQAIVEGGFNLALIQKKDTDELDFSSVFWINLVASIFLYVLVFVGAPYIAEFYEQPVLTKLVRVLSLVFVINAFSIVQEAKLTKEMKFKTLMWVHLPSTVLAGVVSVIMAYKDFGVWSLLVFQVINRLAFSIQIWIYAKWKPLLTFQWQRVKTLFNFGSKLLVAKIVGVIYNNIFLVVIGKFYPVKNVGYYQNSFNLVNTPAGTITSVLGSVTFSAFSSIQDDNQRLKTGYKKVMQQAFFWICPTYIFAGVLAVPLFDFVFGAQWLPAVPYFRWLCIVGILAPLNTYNLNIVNVKGRSDMFLKLQLVRRGITILAIIAVLLLTTGITALLIVQATSALFTFFLFSYFSGKFIDYPLSEQLKDIYPVFFLSIGIALVIFFIDQRLVIETHNIVRLLAGFGAGGSLYWFFSHRLKLAPYLEFRQLFYAKIIPRFKKK